MGAEVRERRLLEHDLRLAISRGELRLVYQPQQEVRSGSVVGFETLLRWKQPTRGEISPAVFIPIAEETGAILQIGDWVLKTACREAASWPQPLKIAVNVSAVQLYNANFVQDLHQILLDTGLSPSRLEIEITETALVRDFNRALAMLRQVKALGVAIAMDDFGTGYSSLSNLRFRSTGSRSTALSSSRSIPTGRQRPSCGRYWALAAALGCRCSLKASRPAPNCNSCRKRCVTRCRAFCSGGRLRSAASAPTPIGRLQRKPATIPSRASKAPESAGSRRQAHRRSNLALSRYDTAPAFQERQVTPDDDGPSRR
jgi:hypothetical protein